MNLTTDPTILSTVCSNKLLNFNMRLHFKNYKSVMTFKIITQIQTSVLISGILFQSTLTSSSGLLIQCIL